MDGHTGPGPSGSSRSAATGNSNSFFADAMRRLREQQSPASVANPPPPISAAERAQVSELIRSLGIKYLIPGTVTNLLADPQAKLEACRDLIVTRPLETLAVLHAFEIDNQKAVVELLRQAASKNPLLVLSAPCLARLQDLSLKRGLLLEIADRSPQAMMQSPAVLSSQVEDLRAEIGILIAKRLGSQVAKIMPQLALSQDKDRAAIFNETIIADYWGALASLDSYALSGDKFLRPMVLVGLSNDPWRLRDAILSKLESQELRKTVALACTERDPLRGVRELSTFGLSSPLTNQEIIVSAVKAHGGTLKEIIEASGIVDPRGLKLLAVTSAVGNPFGTFSDLSVFRLSPEDTQEILGLIVTHGISIDPWQVAAILPQLERRDPFFVKRVALECANRDPARAILQLDSFGIEDPSVLRFLALRAARSCPQVVAANFRSFQRLEPSARIEILAACIAADPAAVLKNRIEPLPVDAAELTAVANLLLATALDGDPFKAAEALGLLQAGDQQLRIKLAERCAARDAGRCARSFDNFGITDPVARARLCSKCGEQNLWATLESIPKFGLTNDLIPKALVERCYQRSPWRIATLLPSLGVRDQTLLGKIFFTCVAQNTRKAIDQFPNFGITEASVIKESIQRCAAKNIRHTLQQFENFHAPDDEVQSDLIASHAERDPWMFVECLPKLKIKNQDTLALLAQASARVNVRQTISVLQIFQLTRSSDVLDLLGICAERDFRTTKAKASSFIAAGLNTQELQIIVEAHQDPKAAGREARRLGITNPAVVEQVVRAALTANPTNVPGLIRDFALTDATALRRIAQELGRRSPPTLLANFAVFGEYSQTDRLALAREIVQGDGWKLYQIAKGLGLSDPTLLSQALCDSAAHNIVRASETKAIKDYLAEPTNLLAVFRRALVTRRLDNALTVAGISLCKTPVTREQALAQFDLLLDPLLAEAASDPNFIASLKLIKRVRTAKVAPNDSIVQGFDQFDDSTDAFLINLLSQAGETLGTSIIQEILKIYAAATTIPAPDQKLIIEFVQSGFRGFTRKTFQQYRDTYRRSPRQAKQLLEKWKDVSSQILHGEPVDDIFLQDPNITALIYGAYRPVGWSVADVKRILSTIKDNSEHLSKFQFRSDGYPLNLSDKVDLRLRTGEVLDQPGLLGLAEKIQASASAHIQEEDFTRILLKAAQRAANQIDKFQLIAYILQKSGDPRGSALVHELKQLLDTRAMSDARFFTLAGTLQSLTNFILEQTDFIASQAIREGRIELTPKLLRTLSQALQKKEGEQISGEELTEFVMSQLETVLNPEKKLLKQELKKFTGTATETGIGYRAYLSKSKAAYFGRAGAGLCSGDDNWSWNNASFLQMIVVDEARSCIVGNVQLHLFTAPNGKPAVLARPNPTQKFLATQDIERLAEQLLGAVEEFANANNLEVYLPDQSDYQHLLSNREEFAGHIEELYFDKSYRRSIKLTSNLTVETIYKMIIIRKMPPPSR